MKIIFAGTPETAVPTLNALIEAQHDIVAVLTRADAPIGRKSVLTPSAVALRAAELDLRTIKANSLDEQTIALLSGLKADIGVVVAYGAFLPESVLDIPTHGWINLHFSDLPALRGAAPLQWTLINGLTEASTCVFKLVKEMDAGPIYSTERYPLVGDEVAGDLLAELALSGAQQVVNDLVRIEAGADPVQQTSEFSLAPKLSTAQSQLSSERAAIDLFNLYRGVTPEPGAWIDYDGQRLKVHDCALSDRSIEQGIIETRDGKVLWGTNTTALELITVQPAGKQSMRAADWARGLRR